MWPLKLSSHMLVSSWARQWRHSPPGPTWNSTSCPPSRAPPCALSAAVRSLACDLGDETHLVFECPALQDLRVSFAALFQRATTLKQFMWQPHLMRVAHFTDADVRRVRKSIEAMDQTSNPARLAGTDVISCLAACRARPWWLSPLEPT